MEGLKKIVSRQDAYFKLSPSTSNETSINLANDIATYISDESLLSTGNCKIINLSEENILWGFKI